MSLQFYLGASGSGKSAQLHKDIIALAKENPARNFLFLVPDQFTMQTQVDLVKASSCHGIMNIDVLSFSRLAHRIFEELGCNDQIVLDDTGKSLVLRQLAKSIKDKMPVLGANLNKVGYIHEIKSVISEFKQYDIGDKELDEMIEKSEGRGLLHSKLKDLKCIYKAFNDYICNEYITSEETLTLLTRRAEESAILKDAVVIFDGFTGFTPVQYRLIQRLMELTHKVIISITVDADSEPFQNPTDQELFFLSKKTIKDLQKIAQEVNVSMDADVVLKGTYRFENNRALLHLQKNIFRYPLNIYPEETSGVMICEAKNPEDEVLRACSLIKKMVLYNGYRYKDIAVVCGDLNAYADEFVKAERMFDIPIYIDETQSLSLNPFVEYLRSALNVIKEQFSYTSVFHFLRSGFSGLSLDEIDRLENYVLRCGIKGKRKWTESFTRYPRKLNDKEQPTVSDIESLGRLNESREKVIYLLEPLMKTRTTIDVFIENIYEFILRGKIEEQLSGYEEEFTKTGELQKAREYGQIYRIILNLLEQMHGILKNEKVSLEEFIKLLDSGIEELDVGTIPADVDRILVGDIERSRIGEAKMLMFLGVNDGNIPKANTGGGLISDIDREYLKDILNDSGIELSPTPREQVFTQRLYLYLTMTKPKDCLYLSYCRCASGGKSMKESYVISIMRKMFPKCIDIKSQYSIDRFEELYGSKDGLGFLADGLREYADGSLQCMSFEELSALYVTLLREPAVMNVVTRLVDASFFTYEGDQISREIADLLYGKVLTNSVSRLEKFSWCQYAHFLQYGMKLSPREEFEFNKIDLGNVYHSVIESFSKRLNNEGYTLSNFPDELGDRLLEDIIEHEGVLYGESILHDSYRNEYLTKRIYEELKETLRATRFQLSKGEFLPEAFEEAFSETIEIDDDIKMKLRGRIDRIDVCHVDNRVYVKIVDYKSGERKISLDQLFYGISLQQPIYMMAAMKAIEKRMQDKTPLMGAMLYSRVNRPLASGETTYSNDEVHKALLNEMMPSGLVLQDKEVVSKLDKGLGADNVKSDVIPVSLKKDGDFTAASSVISKDDFDTVSSFVEEKVKDIGKKITEGNVTISKTQYEQKTSCEYCDFKDICPYDEHLDGFEPRYLKKSGKDDVLSAMKEKKDEL